VIYQRNPHQLCSSSTNVRSYGFHSSPTNVNAYRFRSSPKTQHDYECMDFQVKIRQCTNYNYILYNLHHHIISPLTPLFALSSIYIHTSTSHHHQNHHKKSSSIIIAIIISTNKQCHFISINWIIDGQSLTSW